MNRNKRSLMSIFSSAEKSYSVEEFLESWKKNAYVFIKESGGEYSASDSAELYRKHYGLRIPEGAMYFAEKGGYLQCFRMAEGVSITDSGKGEFAGILGRQVKFIGEADDGVAAFAVETSNESQTNQVVRLLMRNVNAYDYWLGDGERKSKAGWINNVIKRKEDHATLRSFLRVLEEPALPNQLIEAAELLSSFHWKDENEVEVYARAICSGGSSGTTCDFVVKIRDWSAEEGSYLDSLKAHFGGNGTVGFTPYSNGYRQNVPNPSNFSFDNPANSSIELKWTFPDKC